MTSSKMFKSYMLEKVKITISYCYIHTKVTNVEFQLKYKKNVKWGKMDDIFLLVMQRRTTTIADDLIAILLSQSLEMHFGGNYYREIIHMFAWIVS